MEGIRNLERLKFWLPMILLGIVVGLCFLSLQHTEHRKHFQILNHKVPEFSLPGLHKKNINQNVLLDGHAHILYVWTYSSWECQQGHYIMNKLHKMHPRKSILSLLYKSKSEEVQDWLAKNGNPYKYIMLDQEGELFMKLGLYSVPATIFINEKGNVEKVMVGVGEKYEDKLLL
jgi:cytochrome c biogenesis protein CcmG, thiol:disulfide interchange protein DsbE